MHWILNWIVQRGATRCIVTVHTYRIVAVVVSFFFIHLCFPSRGSGDTMSAFFPFYPLNTYFFFFCFLISLSRFRANATNRNEFEYIKRIKIHPCVNEAHSRIFSIENACCVCIWLVFFWYFCCFSRSFKQYRGNESRDMKMNNFLFWLLYLVCRCSEQPLM